jgi:hypothetical protein
MKAIHFCWLLAVLSATPRGQAKLDWQSFSPSDGAFTVQVPAKPTEFKKTMQSPQGEVQVTVYESAVPGSDGKFILSVSQYPEGTLKAGTEDKHLDNARDGAVASVKGKLKREKSLLLDSYPGRELTIEIEGKSPIILRMYAVKDRLYQLAAVGPQELVTSQDAAKFFDSFKVKK